MHSLPDALRRGCTHACVWYRDGITIRLGLHVSKRPRKATDPEFPSTLFSRSHNLCLDGKRHSLIVNVIAQCLTHISH
jgi:hypothetical protein